MLIPVHCVDDPVKPSSWISKVYVVEVDPTIFLSTK
jgi:hypothetical protein